MTTYFEVQERESRGVERVKSKPKIKLMLDSGAFSAWKRGVEIDIDEYIAYIKKNQHLLHTYVNLDVIPGTPGKPITQDQVEAAAKASHRNLTKMHNAGLKPMPVFHFGERFEWLERLLDEGEEYIGLGGLVGRSPVDQVTFLDRVFTRLTYQDGTPIVKTHGFGIAAFELLKRYPWTTCDATTWAIKAGMGYMLVPVRRNGRFDYSQPPKNLTMSAERKSIPADHYSRLGPMGIKSLEEFCKEVGITLADTVVSYEARARAIVYFMLKFQDAIGEQPFRHRLRGL